MSLRAGRLVSTFDEILKQHSTEELKIAQGSSLTLALITAVAVFLFLKEKSIGIVGRGYDYVNIKTESSPLIYWGAVILGSLSVIFFIYVFVKTNNELRLRNRRQTQDTKGSNQSQ